MKAVVYFKKPFIKQTLVNVRSVVINAYTIGVGFDDGSDSKQFLKEIVRKIVIKGKKGEF